MNREIKFRAWDGKEMFLSPAEIQHLGSWFDAHAPGALYKGDVVFMQYTGLRDKNGNEIYEGDIIQFAEKYFYVVKYEDGKYVGYHAHNNWGKWGDLYKLAEPGFNKYNYVVIGNIYQNPELITTPPLPKE